MLLPKSMDRKKPKKKHNRVEPAAASQAENSAAGLKHLALTWFTSTQAPILLCASSFPACFQGLSSRRDAENYLRDKPIGCFLIRLSSKAPGYILSYRGHNRCRHFIINQNKAGKFTVSGDTQTHSTLVGLIEYYKSSPFEPFGEYLTTSCLECSAAGTHAVTQLSGPDDLPTDRAPTPPPRSNRKPVLASSQRSPQLLPCFLEKNPQRKTQFDNFLNEKNISKTQVFYEKLGKKERFQTPQKASTEGVYRAQAVQNRVHRAQKAYLKQTEQLCCSTSASGTVYSELQLENLNKRAVQRQQQSHKTMTSHNYDAPSSKKSLKRLSNNHLYHKAWGASQGNDVGFHSHGQSQKKPLKHTFQNSVIYATICHRPM